MAEIKYSIVIPIYKNEDSIPRLLDVLESVDRSLGSALEVVFVSDGSPDNSFAILRARLQQLRFSAQLLAHSRNFGSFPAIRTGLAAARGNFFGVMAADLQEPPELLIEFFRALEEGECDVVIGTRISRRDPVLSRITAGLFWGLYRRFVVRDMPPGGVDVFGCNRPFLDHLLKLEEARSSLIALVFWLGFRRKFVPYERLERSEGKSAWTLSKKIEYLLDSIFSFTNYPIRMLVQLGLIGTLLSVTLGIVVAVARLAGLISVPGYTMTMLVVLALGAMNLFGLGLVGIYSWRTYENSKARPLAIVAMHATNDESRK